MGWHRNTCACPVKTFRVKGKKSFLHLGEKSPKRKKKKHVTASQSQQAGSKEGRICCCSVQRAFPWLSALPTALRNKFRILNHELRTIKFREKEKPVILPQNGQ